MRAGAETDLEPFGLISRRARRRLLCFQSGPCSVFLWYTLPRPEIPSSRDFPPNPDVLREIHIRNLAVLAEASVELGAGFNVLSGETGAGKSIVVDSLSLLAGARASTEMVRTGAEALTVSGVFEPEGQGWRVVLEEAGLEAEGDEVLVRRAGEEVELKAERDVLRNAEAITRALGTAFSLLFEDEGAAVERIGKAGSLLAEVEAWEPQAAAWGAELEEARIRLTETARSLQHRLDGLEADPARLDFIEERLATIERLCRKHGGDSGAVLARRAEIEAELAELEGDAENRDELAGEVVAALAAYREAARALSKAREAW